MPTTQTRQTTDADLAARLDTTNLAHRGVMLRIAGLREALTLLPAGDARTAVETALPEALTEAEGMAAEHAAALAARRAGPTRVTPGRLA